MQGTAIWLTAERKECAYETNFHHIVVGRFDFLSSDGAADGPDADGCRGSAERDAEKDFQGPREDTEENHCSGNSGHCGHGQMHKVEDKMLEYLSNAQGAMQNLYQIKRAAELTTVEIPRNMSLLRQSLPGHLKGTAIALLVSDELTDAATQMASLYPFMQQLVTSGTYNVSGYDATGKPINEKHKVNLLSSAERYYIANEVVTKLETINTDLWLLAWQVRTYSWNDLWFGLDPEGWATVMSGKAIVDGLVYEWKYI